MTHQHCWQQDTRRDFIGLSGGIALVGLCLGTVLPLTALALDHAGYQSSLIGLLLALHALGLVLAMPLTARVVAWLGARCVIQYASLGAALNCMVLQGLADSPAALAIGLLALGIMLGLVFNVVETWLNEIIPDAQRGRWVALHCTLFTLFQLSGPLLLKYLPAEHAYQLCGLLLLLALPVYTLLSHRILGQESASDSSLPFRQFIGSAPAIVWSTMLFALFDSVILGLLPLYGRIHGLNESQALLSASVVLAGDTALEYLVGVLADRFSRVRIHKLCAVLLLLCAPLMPFAIGHWYWWPLLFVTGGAAGGIYVLSLTACGQRYAGASLLRITTLLGAAWGIASIAGPLLTGAVTQIQPQWALPSILGFAALILLLALKAEDRGKAIPIRTALPRSLKPNESSC